METKSMHQVAIPGGLFTEVGVPEFPQALEVLVD